MLRVLRSPLQSYRYSGTDGQESESLGAGNVETEKARQALFRVARHQGYQAACGAALPQQDPGQLLAER